MPITTVGGYYALATAIGGGAQAGASIYGAKKAAGAAREAGNIESQAAANALAFEREQETRRQKEYEEERARTWMLQDEERKVRDRAIALSEEDRSRRIAQTRPYAELGGASTNSLLQLMRPNPNVNLRVTPPVGVPSMNPAMMPLSVPSDSLAELTRRRA